MQTDEKLEFSRRLTLVLKRSKKPVNGAMELAPQFNLRHPNNPITSQSAHKWLMGKARPTADKIEMLASWLSVSAHWLRYRSPSDAKQRQPASARRAKLQVPKDIPLGEVEAKLIGQPGRVGTSAHAVVLV